MTNQNEIDLARKRGQNALEEEKKRKRESHSQDCEDSGKRQNLSDATQADRGPQAKPPVEAELLRTSDQAGAPSSDEAAQKTGEEADQAGQKTLRSHLVKEMEMALSDLEQSVMEEDVAVLPPPGAGALPEAAPAGAMAADALPPLITDAMGSVLGVAAGGGDGGGGEPAEPTKQYLDVCQDLRTRIEPAGAQEPLASTWDAFPDHLGEGARARLLALAALHLSAAGAERCPEAVRQLPANSNRILLGAATNCELYQERVVRALARKVGASLLVVDAASLRLDEAVRGEESSGGGDGHEGPAHYGGGSGYESSEDDFDDGMPDLIDADMPGKGAGGRLSYRSKPGGRRGGLGAALGSRHASMAADKLRDEAEKALEGAAAENEKVKMLLARAEKAKEQASAARSEAGKALEGAKTARANHNAAVAAAQAAAEGVSDRAAAFKGVLKGITRGEIAAAVDSAAFEEAFEKCFSEMGTSLAQNPLDEAAVGRLVDAVNAAAKGLTPAAAPGPAAAAAPTTGEAADGTAAEIAAAAQDAETGAKAGAPPSISAPPATSDALMSAVGQIEEAVAAVEAPAPGSRSAKLHHHALQGAAHRDTPPEGGDRPSRLDVAGLVGAVPPPRPTAALSFKAGDRVSYAGRTNPRLVGNMDALQAAISRVESRGEGSHGRLREILPALVMRRSAALAAMQSQAAKIQPEGAPPLASRGRVLSATADRVEVLFDDPFPGGGKGAAGGGCAYSCPPAELSITDDKDDAWAASFQALFEVLREEAANGAVVLFIQSMDRLIRTNAVDHFRKLGALLASMPPRCLVFAAYCTRSLAREKSSGGPSGLSMLFGGGRGGGDPFGGMGDEMPSWMDRFGGGGGGSGRGMSMRARRTTKGKQLSKLLPNHVELHPPNAESAAKAWKKMLDDDVAAMRERSNRAAVGKVLAKCGVACPDLGAVRVSEVALSRRDVEAVVGAAVAGQVAAGAEAAPPPSPSAQAEPSNPGGEAVAMAVEAPTGAAAAAPAALTLAAPHLVAAAAAVQALRAEAAPVPERSALKDVQADQYEKQLLNEVIPPEEIAVVFADIGALESVKTTLHEVVILPLQRPELFTRGALTKPTKGLLLFGPPGTGKTMLAKAVASESGAHFINVNMSAITSKWFGEGERLVRALFSLAHKLAPSVIFVDEIDSFLSKRTGGGQEHEAMRKMKNEFMQHWDGLRTKACDRVLVLAATNRPMDLDEAVIRRMPRRIFVPLPDAANREKILSVILKGEEVDPGMDLGELARRAEGYSGSDLKNLCIAAAYSPIREYLEREREGREKAAGGGGAHEAAPPSMRPIALKDFDAAMKQVTSSTHAESASMSELQRWNEQFGEGGSRRSEPLVYFT